MRERTVILVTHHVTLATPISDYLVHIALDGTIDYQGAPEKALEFEDEDPVISEEIVEKVEEFKEDAEVVTGDLIVKQNLGKLVVDEEKSEGRVSLKTVLKYLAAAGGPIFWSIYLADILIGKLSPDYDVLFDDVEPFSFFSRRRAPFCWVQLLAWLVVSSLREGREPLGGLYRLVPLNLRGTHARAGVFIQHQWNFVDVRLSPRLSSNARLAGPEDSRKHFSLY